MAKVRQGGVNMMVCLPAELKTFLESEATRTWTSQNAQVIRAIRAQMDLAQPEKVAG